jgi:uncharacterized membrane protein
MLAFAIGFFGGLRALTPPAIVALAAAFGWFALGDPLGWMGSFIAAAVFPLLAIAEMAADKLPTTPSRTAPLGLGARILMGALCGACVASASGGALAVGALLGAAGGVAGCYAGYLARTRTVRALGVPDFAVAFAEDLIAVAGALVVVSQL